MRGERIVPSDWLWFLVYPSGVMVHRCRLTPTAHEKSVHYFVSNPTLSDLFHAWAQRQHHRPNALRGKGLLLAFFSLLVEATAVSTNLMEQLPEQFSALPVPLQRAIQLMRCSYDKPFRLSQLAKWCFVSPYHLCWLFRRHLGMTPLGYLTHLRLTIARQFLEETELSVSEIAYLVGYSDLRYFRNLFAKRFGVPPSRCRLSQETKRRRWVFPPPEAT